jgi:hypothetical protein
MAQIKTKKATTRAPRALKAANSPEPTTPVTPPTCTPSVRYTGPTSAISHHHAHEAAQGVKHVWAAPIIAGLALLLTATFAFNAVNASTEFTANSRANDARLDTVRQMHALNARLDTLEKAIQDLSAAQQAQ